MKSFDEGVERRSDAGDNDVDSLLRSFFAAELPSILPPLPNRTVNSLPQSRLKDNRRLGFAEWVAYAALAASVLLIVTARWKFGAGMGDAQIARAISNAKTAIVPEVVKDEAPILASEQVVSTNAGLNDIEYSFMEKQDPVQTSRFVTREGEFEQRTSVRWKICSFYEPRTGERVQWSTPIVSISVTPAVVASASAPRH